MFIRVAGWTHIIPLHADRFCRDGAVVIQKKDNAVVRGDNGCAGAGAAQLYVKRRTDGAERNGRFVPGGFFYR